jgi:hypothetical protein
MRLRNTAHTSSDSSGVILHPFLSLFLEVCLLVLPPVCSGVILFESVAAVFLQLGVQLAVIVILRESSSAGLEEAQPSPPGSTHGSSWRLCAPRDDLSAGRVWSNSRL